MAKVFLHTTNSINTEYPKWCNEERDFSRVPALGEYIATATDSLYYKVQAVIHCPFDGEIDAEVYATLDEYSEQSRLIRSVAKQATKPIEV